MKKYILTVDFPALGLAAGDEVTGPAVDVLLANGKAAEEEEEEVKPAAKKAPKEGAGK